MPFCRCSLSFQSHEGLMSGLVSPCKLDVTCTNTTSRSHYIPDTSELFLKVLAVLSWCIYTKSNVLITQIISSGNDLYNQSRHHGYLMF